MCDRTASLLWSDRQLAVLFRRVVLGASAAALAARGFRPAAAATATLRDAAAAAGLRYGANCDPLIAATPPSYQALFAAECALLAPNFGWTMAAPAPDELDLSRLRPTLAWAGQHGIALTGMHLLWHEAQPEWFKAIANRALAQRHMLRHVTALASRTAGKVYAWNVLNEEVSPDGGLQPQGFTARFGIPAVAEAFEAARQADPAALLVVNEFGVEGAGRGAARKRRGLLALLDQLLVAKAPVQAVGIQSHLSLGMAFDPAGFARFLDEIAVRGLRVMLSELDVLDASAPAGTDMRDQLVADLYARYLAVALAQPAVVAAVTWGLSDRYTWLVPASNPQFRRPDGLPCRPLPFDAEFRPKPAYAALRRALEQAPRRGPLPP